MYNPKKHVKRILLALVIWAMVPVATIVPKAVSEGQDTINSCNRRKNEDYDKLKAERDSCINQAGDVGTFVQICWSNYYAQATYVEIEYGLCQLFSN